MEKHVLRRHVLATLKEQQTPLKREMDLFLNRQFLSHSAYKSAKTVATYLPFTFEVSTETIIHQALKDGKRLLVPKIVGPGKMVFLDYDSQHLVRTAFGLLEPLLGDEVSADEIDLIHVPGLVFNETGYRIGFGGGYYDRYLKGFKGVTISTIYPCQRHDFEPDYHDIAVKEVISVD